MNFIKYLLLYLLFIVTLFISFYYVDIYSKILKKTQEQVLVKQAQIHFYTQVNTRKWNAKFGGVFVKPVDKLKPNKYLPNNTLKVDDNLTLLKINPAWMTRQLSEQLNVKDFSFRITSLNPINPENKASKFEIEALKHFESTKNLEYYKIDTIDQFNYMGALKVSKSCMPCHKHQGYNIGDIRGGISIKLNAQEYFDILSSIDEKVLFVKLLIILFLTSITIFVHRSLVNYRNLNQKVIQRTKELEDEKEYIQNILDIAPDIIIVTDGSTLVRANKTFFDMFHYNTVEEFLKEHDCVCDYFLTVDNKEFSKDKMINGKIWAEYLIDNLNRNHIVKLGFEDRIYFFNVIAKRFNKDEILVIFTDITDFKKREEQLFK